jgi:hypothetical protein
VIREESLMNKELAPDLSSFAEPVMTARVDSAVPAQILAPGETSAISSAQAHLTFDTPHAVTVPDPGTELISFYGMTEDQVNEIPGAVHWPFDKYKDFPPNPEYPPTLLHLIRHVDPVLRLMYGLDSNASLYREEEFRITWPIASSCMDERR